MHATADAINAGFVNETEAAAIRSMWFSDPIQLASLSPFESYFVLSALHAMGDDDGMLYLVHRQWGGMLDTNATTVWERYDPAYADARAVHETDDPPVNSMNDRTSMAHPWSSGATPILSRVALGLTPAAPGYAALHAAPRLLGLPRHGPHRLQWVAGALPTPNGDALLAASVHSTVAGREGGAVAGREGGAVMISTPYSGTLRTISVPILNGMASLVLSRLPADGLADGLSSRAAAVGDRVASMRRAASLTARSAAEDGCTASGTNVLAAWSNASGLVGAPTHVLDAVEVRGALSLRLSDAAPAELVACIVYSSHVHSSSATRAAPPRMSRWDATTRPSPASYPASFVRRDDVTSGRWIGQYGASGYALFNASVSADGVATPAGSVVATTDVVQTPAYVRIHAPARVDTRGVPMGEARERCQPDGPFGAGEASGHAGGSQGGDRLEGRAFGCCTFVWSAPTSDPRAPELPTAAVTAGGRAASGVSGSGFKGSVRLLVDIDEDAAPHGAFNVSFYVLDFAGWGSRAVIKLMDGHSANTLAEAVLADGGDAGAYYTFRVPHARSLLVRLHQVHSPSGDRLGWAPPPVLSAVFVDFDRDVHKLSPKG